MLRTLAIVVAGLLASCNTVSEIVPVGRDTYMVTADVSTAADLSSTSRIKAVKRANAYCAAMGKEMAVQKMDTRQRQVGATADTDLVFSCL